MFLLIPCGSQFSTLSIHFKTARFLQTSVSPLKVSLRFAVSTQNDLKAGPALSTEQRAASGSNSTLPGESNAFAVQEIGPSSQIITSWVAHYVVKIYINIRYTQSLPCGFSRRTAFLYIY